MVFVLSGLLSTFGCSGKGADRDGDGFAASVDCDDDDANVNPDAREACNGVDDDCDGTVDIDAWDAPDWYADADGDGYGDESVAEKACRGPLSYVVDSSDCDDADESVHPYAVEQCDGRDNDCDGVVDPIGSGLYLDNDGDGYGDPDSPVDACALDEGLSASADDCDDSDAGVHPGAVEYCDGIDNDCSGEPETGSTATIYYVDSDHDGYGASDEFVEACEDTKGTSVEGGDCNDDDPTIHPNGDELCDELDNDCDGVVDPDSPRTLYADWDGDGYGDPDAAELICDDSPSDHVEDATDCDDSNPGIHPGSDETWYDGVDADCDGADDYDQDGDGWARDAECDDEDDEVHPGARDICTDGVDSDCDGSDTSACVVGGENFLVDASVEIQGTSSGDQLGSSLRVVDDITGDGRPDVLLGAPLDDDNGSSSGSVVVFSGGLIDGTYDATDADARVVGESTNDYLGTTVGGADLDGDGYTDLVSGAYAYGSGAEGRVYLVPGPIAGVTTAGAPWIAGSTSTNSYFGYRLETGDFDGDGNVDDIAVGSTGVSSFTGEVRVFLGPVSTGAAADATIPGDAAGDYFGEAMATLPDSDGDGIDELLVGARYSDTPDENGGQAYLLSDPADTSATTALFLPEAAYDYLGAEVASLGDHNGDGYGDLAVSSPYRTLGSATGAGVVYGFFGPVSGTVEVGVDYSFQVQGDAYDYLGWAVDSGDVDMDGVDDVVIGGYYGASYAPSYQGVAVLFYAPVEGIVDGVDSHGQFVGDDAYDYQGSAVALTDFDADGGADVWVGANGADPNGSSSGRALLFRGLY